MGYSSHLGAPNPHCVGTWFYFEDASTEEPRQEDVISQERSSASTSTMEEEFTRDHEYSKGLHRALGKTDKRWVWEDEPEDPQPFRHPIFSCCTVPISQASRMLQEPLGFLPFGTRMLGMTESAARLMLCYLYSLIALLCWQKKMISGKIYIVDMFFKQ